jgi:hypothetical protein
MPPATIARHGGANSAVRFTPASTPKAATATPALTTRDTVASRRSTAASHRLTEIAQRVRVYQFETRAVRERFADRLACYVD